MRCPAWLLAALLIAGCSAPEPTRAVPATTAPRTASPSAVPSPTGPTDPTTTPNPQQPSPTPVPPSEPDFSGTGCFPDDPPLPIEVTTTPTVLDDGRVRITIEIVSTESVVVEHRHGQEIDASVDHQGREIWRWSTVAPFVDPYGYEFTYEPGETRRFTVVWDGGEPADTVHGFWIANVKTPEPPGRVICFDDAPLA